MSNSDDTPQRDGKSQDAHQCPWCPVEPRGLYAVAYNAVLAWDMARAGTGDQSRAVRKMAELREYVMDVYSPQVNAHFDALEREKPPDVSRGASPAAGTPTGRTHTPSPPGSRGDSVNTRPGDTRRGIWPRRSCRPSKGRLW